MEYCENFFIRGSFDVVNPQIELGFHGICDPGILLEYFVFCIPL